MGPGLSLQSLVIAGAHGVLVPSFVENWCGNQYLNFEHSLFYIGLLGYHRLDTNKQM